MPEFRTRAWSLSLSLLLLGSGALCAQDYPNKPVRIVTSLLGGGTDFLARLVAQGISGPLKQPVIVDNRSSGAITGEIVSRSPPDGYTLLVIGQAHWIGPLLQIAPYDAVKDFSPVSMLDRSPSVVAVHPSLPVKSVFELIALAKTKPGQLNYASTAAGSAGHMAGELFKSMAGVNIVWVPYKSVGAAFTDLMSNQVQVSFITLGSVEPHITSGRLKALAVAAAKPSVLLPELPTAGATGLPGYEAQSITAVLVPAHTPTAIVARLHREIARYFSNENVKAQVFKTGAEAVGSSPEELAAAINSDIAKFGKVIKDAGIKVN